MNVKKNWEICFGKNKEKSLEKDLPLEKDFKEVKGEKCVGKPWKQWFTSEKCVFEKLKTVIVKDLLRRCERLECCEEGHKIEAERMLAKVWKNVVL